MFLVHFINGGRETGIRLLVYSGGMLLLSSLFSSEADLIHDAFFMFSSKMLNAGEGGAHYRPCSLDVCLSFFHFDFINVGIGGSSLVFTLQSDTDSSKSSISHRTAATFEGKLHSTANITRNIFAQ